MRILGLSGSLRSSSSNTALLHAAARVAPPGVIVEPWDRIGELPHFHPDLEGELAPPLVQAFRAHVESCAAVLICSPEYAGGIPGTFKNALDWLVGCMAMYDKPTAAINASPISTHAHDALMIVLSMLSVRLVREACIALPLRGKKLDAVGIAASPELATPLAQAVLSLASAAGRA